MIVVLSDRAGIAITNAPIAVRKAFARKLLYLEQNLNHPSLHAKKYDEARDLWQARISRDWRFYFRIERNTYLVTNIRPHPK